MALEQKIKYALFLIKNSPSFSPGEKDYLIYRLEVMNEPEVDQLIKIFEAEKERNWVVFHSGLQKVIQIGKKAVEGAKEGYPKAHKARLQKIRAAEPDEKNAADELLNEL